MADVNTQDTNQQSGWTSALLLAGTFIGAIYALPVVVAHLPLLAVAAVGAGAYAATSEKRREKTKEIFKTVTKAYKNAFSNFGKGWKKAVSWAEKKEAAAKATQAPEATGGASPLASKEAAPGFKAVSEPGVKAAPTPKAPAPVQKPAGLAR